MNYDLHWNPTRMVQRAGRVDRIGTEFETLFIYNMFPDAGLERLLGLVESLSSKIAAIDQAGFLDASVKFGESQTTIRNGSGGSKRQLTREDLRLICFDVISS